MARNVGTSIENAFTRGLVTEVTGVNSPENSVLESENIIYDRVGPAKKRGAFVLEDGAEFSTLHPTGVRLEYVWETVADASNLNLVVIQSGYQVHFYTAGDDLPLSASKKSFILDLRTYKTSDQTDQVLGSSFCSFSSGRGYLFVAHPMCDTVYVSYDSGTDSFGVKKITLEIRDFEGIDDGVGIETRPTTLTNTRKYNLYNQGWYATAKTTSSGGESNVLTRWDTARTDFPSNKDVWWNYISVHSETGTEYFNTGKIDELSDVFGNTPASKGHYIISPFKSNRSVVSGITGIEELDSKGQRPSVVAFFAGRVFYSGVGTAGYTSKIYFSQIIERDEQIGRCYQLNDPTSREAFDLLDSDGGVIDIPDMNVVYDIRVVEDSIIVFASNGIWSVSGTDSGPFRATDYSVKRVSIFPAINKTTIAVISGTPIWWNNEGIYTLKSSELGLSTEVTSLTVPTIQTFYDEIPQSCRILAKGSFNEQDNLVMWIYSDDELNPGDYNRLLVFDVVSGAFYPISLPEGDKRITGICSVRASSARYLQDEITDVLGEIVVDSNGTELITEEFLGFSISRKKFKFLVEEPRGATFGDLSEDEWLDWGDTPYDAYFITGYRIRGEILRKGQTNYLAVISENLPGSSLFVQGVWDYRNGGDTGRWTNPQQCYRQKSFTDYQRSRLRIRGNGYTLQFRFFGEVGKPFKVIGWAGFETTDGGP